MKRNSTKKISATWVQDHCYSAWIEHDARSAPAMLRGRGVGRELLYEDFARIKRIEDPSVSLEKIDHAYAKYIAAFEFTASKRAAQRPAPVFTSAWQSAAAHVISWVAAVWLVQAIIHAF